MTNKSIKSLLYKNNLHIYDLCIALGVAKSTLNEWSHHVDYKGHEAKIKSTLKHLISKKGGKHYANEQF